MIGEIQCFTNKKRNFCYKYLLFPDVVAISCAESTIYNRQKQALVFLCTLTFIVEL